MFHIYHGSQDIEKNFLDYRLVIYINILLKIIPNFLLFKKLQFDITCFSICRVFRDYLIKTLTLVRLG